MQYHNSVPANLTMQILTILSHIISTSRYHISVHFTLPCTPWLTLYSHCLFKEYATECKDALFYGKGWQWIWHELMECNDWTCLNFYVVVLYTYVHVHYTCIAVWFYWVHIISIELMYIYMYMYNSQSLRNLPVYYTWAACECTYVSVCSVARCSTWHRVQLWDNYWWEYDIPHVSRTSRCVHFQTCSFPKLFTSKSCNFQTCSLPNLKSCHF